MTIKGKFITFEGGEGCGKSTQSFKLFEYFKAQGVKVIHTREIGGTQEAEKIRELVFSMKLNPMSEMLLVMAARYEHLKHLIIPALVSGTTVICDRYVDSTAVYQTINSSITMEQVYALHRECMQFAGAGNSDKGVMPEISFFLDLPPNEGLQRAAARGNLNKFDECDVSFHQAVYGKFKIIAQNTDRFCVINCLNKDQETIHHEILQQLQSRVND